MPHAFSRRLGESPILRDGAMGTALYARGVSPDACFDGLNLNRPALVQAVHAEYVSVGADCVETNTFGANRFKLAVHGLSDRVRETSRDVDREIERFRRKLQAGARWVQTQPVYDLAQLDRFRERAGGSPVPVLVGVLPLHSFRHAEFLHNEVPGITIPDAVRARLREAGDRALRAGIELAQSLVHEVRRRYAGAYLMPSFGRFEVVAEVLDAIH